jgi:hydrophobic/amphiphilic exporter-1 (mainly G- bacteria), HAE1 family
MYKFAINRPITTLMLFLSLIFFGMMSFKGMPVSLFPKIDFPMVTVKTMYYGADPKSVESKVTDEIEEAISTIGGLDKIISTSSENISIVSLIFDMEVDINEATNEVRDKISSAVLPFDVEKPLVSKFDIGGAAVLSLFVASDTVDAKTLMKTIDTQVKPKIQRIRGIGGINIIGYRDRQIRIYPEPFALNKYNLTPTELKQLIQANNIKQSGGKLIDTSSELMVSFEGNMKSIDGIKNMQILPGVLLKDIAKVEDSLADENSLSSLNGVPGVILQIQKISGENTIDIIQSIKDELPSIKESIGDSYTLQTFNDTSNFILASINSVKFDLIYGAILAIIIVFLFLRNVTATIVSAVAIPTSIIGTFFVLDIFGYELNKLTLLGLTLAIGIFIDDAIVVIENIYKKMESGLDKVDAAFEGVKEIAFSILAISAMLLAVFIPIGFMGGIVGQFFNSFAITVASGIFISYFVAIMLIPTLGARMLKSGESAFYRNTEKYFVAMDRFYVSIVTWTVSKPIRTIVLTFITLIISLQLGQLVGQDFAPKEDKSELQVSLKAKNGINLHAMQEKSSMIADEIRKSEYVEYVALTVAYNTAREPHKAQIYVKLKAIEERDKSQSEIVNMFRSQLKDNQGLQVTVSNIPDIKGAGADVPFQLLIKGDNFIELEVVASKLMTAMKAKEGIVDIETNFERGKPQLSVNVQRDKSMNHGILAKDISELIATTLSSDRAISQYEEDGKQYDITLRFDDENRKTVEDLKQLQVKTNDGNTVALEGLVKFEKSVGPVSINHYNRQRQVTVSANHVKELALGDVVAIANESMEKNLPKSMSFTLLGMAEEMEKMMKEFGLAFGLAFLMMFIILAALYESLVQPIIIMIALPLSFIGVMLALVLSGKDFNLFTMMGIILLMGMVGKNAVLLVDFANQQLRKGIDVKTALITAGEKRLRPILMTTLAMVFAMLPLIISHGPGFESNSPMATAIVGGLISSMVLTLVVIPAIYKLMSPIDLWMRKYYDFDFMKKS